MKILLDPSPADPAAAEPEESPAVAAPPSTSRFAEMAKKLQDGLREAAAGSPPAPDADPKKETPAARPKEEKAPAADKPAAPRDEDAVPALLKGKAADEFRNLRKILKGEIDSKSKDLSSSQKQIEQLRAELEQARKSGEPTKKELEELRQAHSELVERWERQALETSPKFNERYQRRAQSAIARAKSALGKDKEADAEAVLAMKDTPARKKAMSALFEDLDPTDQVALSIAVTEMDSIRTERDIEVLNYRESSSRMKAEEETKARQDQEFQSARKAFIADEVLRAAKQFDVFKQIDGDDEHNKQIPEFENEVRQFISGEVSETAAAFLPVMAAQGLYLQDKVVPKLTSRISELEAELAQYKGAGPRVGSGAPSGGKASDGSKRPSFAEAFRREWPGV